VALCSIKRRVRVPAHTKKMGGNEWVQCELQHILSWAAGNAFGTKQEQHTLCCLQTCQIALNENMLCKSQIKIRSTLVEEGKGPKIRHKISSVVPINIKWGVLWEGKGPNLKRETKLK
jgi:hypothetical protein